ncbi:myosin-12-like [Apium graveolens]|uniref:myosin-12-like n=1 Tax=Apium graveolens TaxID=4045 RepID=UPI003D7B96B7
MAKGWEELKKIDLRSAATQEEITELRKRADEFLCMFNEVQNESKDRLKEIEESQLKLAQLQTTLERLELNVFNLESENQVLRQRHRTSPTTLFGRMAQGFRASLM